MSRLSSFVLGLVMLSGSVYFAKETLDLKRLGAITAGVVIDQRKQTSVKISQSSVDYSITYAPVVEFTPEGGVPIQFRSDLWSSWPKNIGEKVTVLYKKSKPEVARVNGFLENWLMSIVLGILGGSSMLAALGMMESVESDPSSSFEINRIE